MKNRTPKAFLSIQNSKKERKVIPHIPHRAHNKALKLQYAVHESPLKIERKLKVLLSHERCIEAQVTSTWPAGIR
jgi:hypothetical protein